MEEEKQFDVFNAGHRSSRSSQESPREGLIAMYNGETLSRRIANRLRR